MESNGYGSSSFLNNSVLGEIKMSNVLEQPGDIALPYVKSTEKSKSDGTLHMAGGDDSSRSLNQNSAIVDRVANSPRIEMLGENISKKKKKKKKKKKGKSTKSMTDRTVDGIGVRKCDLDSAVASCQLSREWTNNPSSNYDKGLKNHSPSAGVNPKCATCKYGFSKDS